MATMALLLPNRTLAVPKAAPKVGHLKTLTDLMVVPLLLNKTLAGLNKALVGLNKALVGLLVPSRVSAVHRVVLSRALVDLRAGLMAAVLVPSKVSAVRRVVLSRALVGPRVDHKVDLMAVPISREGLEVLGDIRLAGILLCEEAMMGS